MIRDLFNRARIALIPAGKKKHVSCLLSIIMANDLCISSEWEFGQISAPPSVCVAEGVVLCCAHVSLSLNLNVNESGHGDKRQPLKTVTS